MKQRYLKYLIISLLMFTNLTFCLTSKAQEEEQNLLAPLKLRIAKTENYFVNLEDVLHLALENNIALQISREQEKIDKLSVITAYSELLPDITPSYEQSRFQGGFQIFGNQTFRFARTTIGPRLSLDCTLYSGGETIYSILAAKRQHKATKYSILSSTNQLLLDTTNAYYDLLKADKELEISKQEINESEEVLKLNKKRLEVGLGTILEVTQSEEQLALSKRKFITASKNILKATQNLNRILNLPVDLNIIAEDTEITKLTLITDPEMETLLETAIDNRPDLKEVKELKRVYMAQRGIARSKFFPKLTLSTYWGGTGPRFSDLNEQRYIGYGVSLNFLKNLGVNYIANYKKSGPLLKQVDLQIQQKFRDIETEVADALLDADTSDRQITVARTGLKSANDAFKYATKRLEAGVGSNIDVLSAQTHLTTSRTNLIDSIIEYNKAQVSLLNAIGIITIDKILGKQEIIIQQSQENTSNTDTAVTKKPLQ